MEAYLHFIIETGLKKHHTLMELERIFDNDTNANIFGLNSEQLV